MPCNLNQRELAQHVKRGIRAAGGTPIEFNTISVSDGVSMGTEGMRASLVSREVIADSIELVARGHLFDGLVCLVGCDKTIPGAVMALARARHPGPRPLQRLDRARPLPRPRRDDPGRVRGGRRARGREDDRRGPARARERRLPGRRRVRRPVHRQHDGDRRSSSSASARAASNGIPGDRTRTRTAAAERGRAARDGARPRRTSRPSQILTREALENAIAAVAATGGSTNGVLHLLAIARELGVPLELDDFDTIAARTPVVADLKPGGRYVATDLHEAGGVALVARELCDGGLVHGDARERRRRARSARSRDAVRRAARPGRRRLARARR